VSGPGQSRTPPRHVLILRPGSETLVAFLGGGDRFNFDGEGRLREARLAGRVYRRGLEGKVLERRWDPASGEVPAERRFLSPEEADAFLEEAHALVRKESEEGRLPVVVPAEAQRELVQVMTEGARPLLERIFRWDAERYRDDVARCRAAYAPIGILPPDRYRSLVVQATLGCSFNSCRFCTSFEDVPFRAREAGEFRDHVRVLRGWLGRGIRLYRSLFLGSANALLLPTERLEALLEVLQEELPEGEGPCPAQGVHSFIDGFSTEPKGVGAFERLGRLGLRRLYLGLETGSDDLRARLGKPGATQEYVELVRVVKEAGLAIAVMVILWAGGEEFAREHEEETARALAAMPLGRGDLVFLSPLYLPEGVLERDLLEGRSPLDEEGRRRQIQALRAAVPSGGGAPRVRWYDVREFLY